VLCDSFGAFFGVLGGFLCFLFLFGGSGGFIDDLLREVLRVLVCCCELLLGSVGRCDVRVCISSS
jgi:hypothetical protein